MGWLELLGVGWLELLGVGWLELLGVGWLELGVDGLHSWARSKVPN